LDFHTHRQLFPLTMLLELGPQIDEQSVLESLRLRHCCARAFGIPIDRVFVKTLLPALAMAEHSRRTAASFVRALTH